MKFKLIIPATFIITAFITGCAGDHAANDRSDTATSAIPAKWPANWDTSKTTNTTGESGNVDNSGSGGVLTAKDTTHWQANSPITVKAIAKADTSKKADTTKKK